MGQKKKERKNIEAKMPKESHILKNIHNEDRKKFSDEEVYSLFTTAYYIASNDHALVESEKLLKFLELHKVKVPSHYRNYKSIQEVIECISTCIKNDILLEISKCLSLNLQIDELTDITSQKVLTMNLH